MNDVLARLLNDYHRGRISRRQLLQVLGVAAVGAPLSAALGRAGACGRSGHRAATRPPSSRCSSPPGWKTVSLDHITIPGRRLPEGGGVLHALMGWKLRSDDGKQAVMDIGDWGSVIFKQVPAATTDRRRGGCAAAGAAAASRARCRVVLLRHRAVEREESRGGAPEARPQSRGRQRRQGIRELPCEGSRRIRSADQQRQRPREDRRTLHANAKLRGAGAVRIDRMEDRVAGSPLVRRHELQGERVVLLQSPRLEADVRRGKSERVHDRRRSATSSFAAAIRSTPTSADAWTRRRRRRGSRTAAARRRPARSRDRSHLVRHLAVGHRRREGGARETRPQSADRHVAGTWADGTRTRFTSPRSRAITRRRRTDTTCRSATSRTTSGWRCRTRSDRSRPARCERGSECDDRY